MDIIQEINDYVGKDNWEINENSNMSYSLQGMNNQITEKAVEEYWLNEIYDEKIQDYHKNGRFHIHDLGRLSVYCVGWDLEDLLKTGFKGVRGKIESKPAKHFDTALLQLVNFMYTLQGESAGAQAVSNFDTLLAPFIYYDCLSERQVEQKIQQFLYNINVPTRTGFQSPFVNVTMDLKIPSHMENKPVIIGGEEKEKTYGDFQEEVDLFNKVFAEVMMEGDAKGRPFTFPIPTYSITKEFNWENETLEPMWEMTAKYGIPYFSNFINSDMDPEDARSMCPVAGDERIILKSKNGNETVTKKINAYYHDNKNEIREVYANGKFVKARPNKWENQNMLEVTLQNNHKIKLTEKHKNLVKTGPNTETKTIPGKDLEKGMYLPYSLKEYSGEGGMYQIGYFIGAYAGDGSTTEHRVTFSLSEEKKETLKKIQGIAETHFGANTNIRTYDDTKLITLEVYSQGAVGTCNDFVKGTGTNKKYSDKILGKSKEFREGILDGHMDTDGGTRNRIYTSSKNMVESLNKLAATLGTTTSVYTDNRGKEDTYSDNPNYSVLIYQLNRNSYSDLWFKEDNKLWMKITDIASSTEKTGYCLEVINDEPVFTLAKTGVLTHNCRLRLDNRELEKRGGGLFGSNPLTGSIGVVTLNLPRLAYQSEDEEEFFEKVFETMEVAKDSLEVKRETLEKLTVQGLYPYSKFYLRKIKEGYGNYWENHFSTIGLIGMNEASKNLIGEDLTTKNGHELAEKTLVKMRDKLKDFQEETGNLYNLEATPGEGSSYKLALKDKEEFPDIKQADGEEPMYTNSTQLPAGKTQDIHNALNHQNPLQTKYTGGTVFHTWLGENAPDAEATKKLVKNIANNYELPYYTMTPTFSICPSHGYIKGEKYKCPDCGEKTEVYSRVVGYLRPVQKWNPGKEDEFERRADFSKKGV